MGGLKECGGRALKNGTLVEGDWRVHGSGVMGRFIKGGGRSARNVTPSKGIASNVSEA